MEFQGKWAPKFADFTCGFQNVDRDLTGSDCLSDARPTVPGRRFKFYGLQCMG